jgi:hypothetical protein
MASGKRFMKKFILMAVLVGMLALRMAGQSGNSLESPQTVPGPITYHMLDQYNQVWNYEAFRPQLESFIVANSYGRNTARVLLEDCTLYKGVNGYLLTTNEPTFSVSCGSSLGWSLGSCLHETGHSLLQATHAGTATWANHNVTVLDVYGDPYSPMGRNVIRHYNAFEKERMGFIGAADSLRPVLVAGASGEYRITRIDSQTEGAKCLKLLVEREIKRGQTGKIYYDRLTFLYLELRADHLFKTGGGGKKRGGSYSAGPAVQVRVAAPAYKGQINGYFPGNFLLTNVGNLGGLGAGAGFSDYSRVLDGGVASFRNFSVTVTALDSEGATIRVTYLN